jgi:hypothetical protein
MPAVSRISTRARVGGAIPAGAQRAWAALGFDA